MSMLVLIFYKPGLMYTYSLNVDVDIFVNEPL